MAKKEAPYRKLAGQSGLFWATRLWLAHDHFLVVTSVFGSEHYRRFYFRDIEALTVRANKMRLAWNVASGVTFLFAGGIAAFAWSMEGSIGNTDIQTTVQVGSIICGLLAAVALLVFLVNNVKGASSELWVQIGGTQKKVGLPRRTRPARRIVERLAPLIEQAQVEHVSQPASGSAG